MKYVDTLVTFAEVPDEISLCINISNCKQGCPNCHSPWLAEDIGDPLTQETILKLVKENDGITCVCFMGGDSEPDVVHELSHFIKENTNLKTAWYSGKEKLPLDDALDYVKLGPYIEDKGPLDSRTTNQRFYKLVDDNYVDITYKFWKDEICDIQKGSK